MMKKTTAILSVLPLLGIALFYISHAGDKGRGGAVPAAVKVASATSGTARTPAAKASRQAEEARQHEDARAEALNNLTLKRMDLAAEASQLKASDFGKNGAALMSKNKELFDAWNLNHAQRDEFVSILSEQSARLAEVSLKGSTSWPVDVGHAANRKFDAAHSKAQMQAYQRIQAETRRELTALVGAERAQEYEKLGSAKARRAAADD